MNEQELHKQIILSHYNDPQNKVDNLPEGYLIQKGVNPSCGDELELYVKLDGNTIEDVKYNGSGCSICCASASILTQEVKNKSISEVISNTYQFEQMLKGEEFTEDVFEDAIAFKGIANFPARFKCAFLPWKTLSDLLTNKE